MTGDIIKININQYMSFVQGTNHDYRGDLPNFERDKVATKELLLKASPNEYDDGHLVYCEEDKKTYKLDKSAAQDAVTGYFHPFGEGGVSSEDIDKKISDAIGLFERGKFATRQVALVGTVFNETPDSAPADGSFKDLDSRYSPKALSDGTVDQLYIHFPTVYPTFDTMGTTWMGDWLPVMPKTDPNYKNTFLNNVTDFNFSIGLAGENYSSYSVADNAGDTAGVHDPSSAGLVTAAERKDIKQLRKDLNPLIPSVRLSQETVYEGFNIPRKPVSEIAAQYTPPKFHDFRIEVALPKSMAPSMTISDYSVALINPNFALVYSADGEILSIYDTNSNDDQAPILFEIVFSEDYDPDELIYNNGWRKSKNHDGELSILPLRFSYKGTVKQTVTIPDIYIPIRMVPLLYKGVGDPITADSTINYRKGQYGTEGMKAGDNENEVLEVYEPYKPYKMRFDGVAGKKAWFCISDTTPIKVIYDKDGNDITADFDTIKTSLDNPSLMFFGNDRSESFQYTLYKQKKTNAAEVNSLEMNIITTSKPYDSL